MEKNFKTRTGLIIGNEGLDKLKNSNVIVFGVGGVGSFAAEAIARAGVGKMTIVDFDKIPIMYSLLVIAVILLVSVLISIAFPKKNDLINN